MSTPKISAFGELTAISTEAGEILVIDVAKLGKLLISLAESNPQAFDSIQPKPLISLNELIAHEDSPVIKRISAHSGAITAMAVSPDRTRIATGSCDHSLRICVWE